MEVRPWGEASAYDVLWADRVIVERDAWGAAEEQDDDEAEED